MLAEIGAGYGRLATVALQARTCRYWVFDIAPALALSEWYLSATFPDRKTFGWRPFSRWEDVAAEVTAADLAFFSIDQLSLILDRSVTVFAGISVLHEMLPQDWASSLREDDVLPVFTEKLFIRSGRPAARETLDSAR